MYQTDLKTTRMTTILLLSNCMPVANLRLNEPDPDCYTDRRIASHSLSA